MVRYFSLLTVISLLLTACSQNNEPSLDGSMSGFRVHGIGSIPIASADDLASQDLNILPGGSLTFAAGPRVLTNYGGDRKFFRSRVTVSSATTINDLVLLAIAVPNTNGLRADDIAATATANAAGGVALDRGSYTEIIRAITPTNSPNPNAIAFEVSPNRASLVFYEEDEIPAGIYTALANLLPRGAEFAVFPYGFRVGDIAAGASSEVDMAFSLPVASPVSSFSFIFVAVSDDTVRVAQAPEEISVGAGGFDSGLTAAEGRFRTTNADKLAILGGLKRDFTIDTNAIVCIEDVTIAGGIAGVAISTLLNQFDDVPAGACESADNSEDIIDILISEGVHVRQHSYALNTLPPGSVASFDFAPDTWQNRYTPRRRHFTFDFGNALGVLWQDADNNIQLTRVVSSLDSYEETTLPSNGDVLVAATNNAETIFYITLEMASRAERAARLTLHRYTNGNYRSVLLDTSPAKLNTIVSDSSWVGLASLTYHKGQLGFILARTRHRSGDGLNHQAADAIILDANTLAPITDRWQTSGHSFDSYLTVSSDGSFLGIDLGDNFPRGIHLHKFDATNRSSRVVYTFKTAHGTEPTNSAGRAFPVYQAISTANQTFYQWSNDVSTYTELASVVETSQGYTVVFAGEPDAQGRAINNARIGTSGSYLMDARNLGLVTARKDFENVASHWDSRNVVPDELIVTTRLPGSFSEEGGFYDFQGGWQPQRNTGVVWLTNYRDAARQNASRPKAINIGNDRILVLWEVWSSNAYVETYMMLVDAMGRQLLAPTSLGQDVRLHRRDDPIVIDGNVYVITSHQSSQRLQVTVFNFR